MVSLQDIRTAFDSMPHQLVCDSLLARGVRAIDVGLHIQELTDVEACISIPFVGSIDLFPFHKGGKQGGVATPDEWRAIIDHIMEPVVSDWNSKGYGFHLTGPDGTIEFLVNHAVFADNVLLFATYTKMMQTYDAGFGCRFQQTSQTQWAAIF